MSYKRFVFYLLLFSCFSPLAGAQNTLSITGTVKDRTGVLPGAAIFVSGYKMATVTNNKGEFALQKLAPGNYDLLIQMIGYVPFKKNIILEKSVNLSLTLVENITVLNEVVIKPDPDRAYYLSLFRDFFIGRTPNAENCKILNTHILTTNFNRETNRLSISAKEFLIIENKSLGYRIKYLLEYFEYDFKSRTNYYAGYSVFEDLKGSKAKQKKWAKAREIAYNGSSEHFFKALYENKVTEEGFIINKLIKIPNPARKPDSLIETNIKRLMMAGKRDGAVRITISPNDSLSYWLKQKKEPKLIDKVVSADVSVDTLVRPFNKNLKALNYKDALYVTYKNEFETPEYRKSGNWQPRPPDLERFQISVVHLMRPSALIFANGAVLDPRSFLYEGVFAYEKMADTLPMNYVRPTKNNKE